MSRTLDEAKDDTSAHNKSSMIFVFEPSPGKKLLFTGDASVDSFYNMYACSRDFIRNCYWLKVPHHGSKHNLNSLIISHIHPEVAYISTEKVGKYLNMCTVNALKKSGCRVYSTHHQGDMLHGGHRSGYSAVQPL